MLKFHIFYNDVAHCFLCIMAINNVCCQHLHPMLAHLHAEVYFFSSFSFSQTAEECHVTTTMEPLVGAPFGGTW